jgi:hypothetical protein
MISRLFSSGPTFATLGTLLASAFNFLSFVVFPSTFSLDQFTVFVEHSYLSGFYMAIAASSVAPISIFLLRNGVSREFKKYILLSALLAIFICLIGSAFAFFPWSYLMVAAAILMHMSGAYLGAMIFQERHIAIMFLQVVQPASLAGLIVLNQLAFDTSFPWALLYLLSACAGVALHLFAARHREIAMQLTSSGTTCLKEQNVLPRILASLSFPLFFHVELFIIGNFSDLIVGEYAVIQKLYMSVSTSFFGVAGVVLLKRDIEESETFRSSIPLGVFLVAGVASFSVIVLGTLIERFLSGSFLPFEYFIYCSAMSFLYVICSYCSMKLALQGPFRAIGLISASLLVYILFFYIITPTAFTQFLLLSALFFATFLVLYTLMSVVWTCRGIVPLL